MLRYKIKGDREKRQTVPKGVKRMPKKKSVLDFVRMKKEGELVAWVTAYDFPMAMFAEQAGMDMVLVGDSMGMGLLNTVRDHLRGWPV